MPEVNYQFRERMLQVHKPDRRMPWVVCGNDQVEVTSGWRICIPDRKDPVLYNAARDLEDYFAVSMGVYPGVMEKTCADKSIVYCIDPSLGERKYRLVVKREQILLRGGGKLRVQGDSAQLGAVLTHLQATCPAADIKH